MKALVKSQDQLLEENQDLGARLEEAEDLLSAIRSGNIDALMVQGSQGPQVYTLQGADQPYRVYVETMNEGAVTLSSDGTILYANNQFAEFVGEALEQTVGKSFHDFVVNADHDVLGALVREIGGGSRRAEITLKNRTGLLIPARLSARQMELGGERFICLVVTDLSGQKLQEQLREADRRKDEFLAMLGHELRNPLAIMHNVLQVLHKKYGDADASAEMRGMIEEQVRQMGRLIDDLLDISRVTTGKIRLESTLFDLTKVLADTVESYRDGLEANGLTLSLELPNRPLFVRGDKTRIAQVIGNLLNNANKFTDSGGKVTVALSADLSANRAAIRVRDTGIGIDGDNLGRVFDTFAQADRSLERSRGGLGLGLALVKGLVELHGGTVRAASDGLGQGSQFIIQLPIEGATSEEPSGEAPKVGPTRAFRILVIEDNPAGALSMQMLLKHLGHVAEVAYNGMDGLAAAQRFKPDVVLCDIGLPGLDGYQIARRLRTNEESRQSLLIALSGYGQEEDKQRALDAGFDMHCIKPLDINLLEKFLADLG